VSSDDRVCTQAPAELVATRPVVTRPVGRPRKPKPEQLSNLDRHLLETLQHARQAVARNVEEMCSFFGAKLRRIRSRLPI
jgi:hypothetical protein